MAAALPFIQMGQQGITTIKQNKSTIWLLFLLLAAVIIVLAVLGKLGKWFSFLKPTNLAGKAVGLDHRVLKSASPTFPDGSQMKWGDILGGPFAMLKHMKKKTDIPKTTTTGVTKKKSGKWF